MGRSTATSVLMLMHPPSPRMAHLGRALADRHAIVREDVKGGAKSCAKAGGACPPYAGFWREGKRKGKGHDPAHPKRNPPSSVLDHYSLAGNAVEGVALNYAPLARIADETCEASALTNTAIHIDLHIYVVSMDRSHDAQVKVDKRQ